MADTSIHYLVANPDAMWEAMMEEYSKNGGDVLFPGDEKSILLRTVQQILVIAYAAFDNAARMRTTRYAVGDYLDLIAEGMPISRNEAEHAVTQIKLTIRGESGNVSIPSGTLFSYNGLLTFETTEYATTITDGEDVYLTIPVRCLEAGEAGNSMKAGSILQPVEAMAMIVRAEIVSDATGGREREQDDALRERLFASGYSDSVTGPEQQYSAKTMDVSSGIVDASAVADSEFAPGSPEIGVQYGLERGQVLISLLFADDTSEEEKQALIDAVHKACSTDNQRPLTDQLIVREAGVIQFSIKVRYMIREDAGDAAAVNIMNAVEAYKEWQCNKIGRAFDPYRLTSMLYDAECSRVQIMPESTVNGEPADYMPIAKTKRLVGTVTMEEITDG